MLTLTSCSIKNIDADKDEIILNSSREYLFLEKIDFDYNDLDLTEKEIEVIEKYQKDELFIGQYPINYYYEKEISDSGVDYSGFNYLMMLALDKIFYFNEVVKEEEIGDLIDLMEIGEVDITLNLFKTEARDEKIDFSSNFIKSNIYLYSLESITESEIDLNNMTIGAEGDAQYLTKSEIDRYNVNYISFENIDEGLEMLEMGKIDGIVGSINLDYIAKNLKKKLISQYLLSTGDNIGYDENNDDMKYLSSAFEKAYKYKLSEILIDYDDYYISEKLEKGTFFTNEERAFIESTEENPIKLTNVESGANVYLDEDGNLTGLSIEIFKLISEKIGWEYDLIVMENFQYEPKKLLDEWSINGEVDGFLSSAVEKSYEDDIYLDTSIDIAPVVVGYNYSGKLITDVDYIYAKIGLVSNAYYNEYFQLRFPYKELYYYSKESDMIDAFYKGEIDYFVLNDIRGFNKMFFIDNVENIQIAGYIDFPIETATALVDNKRGKMIQEIYNKVAEVTDITDVKDKYTFTSSYNYKMEKQDLRSNIYIVGAIVFIVSSLSIVIILIYFLRKTHKLKELYEIESKTDRLTGLLNRNALFLNYDKKSVENMEMAFIDLDDFKEINDVYGHRFGDEILKSVADKMKSLSGDDVEIYRIGGDEFLLICRKVEDEFFHRLRNEIALPVNIEGKQFKITASIGVYTSSLNDKIMLSDILSIADYAMYEVKKNGKNEVNIVDSKFLDK